MNLQPLIMITAGGQEVTIHDWITRRGFERPQETVAEYADVFDREVKEQFEGYVPWLQAAIDRFHRGLGNEEDLIDVCWVITHLAKHRQVERLFGGKELDEVYYCAMRLDGSSHKWAEMLALQSPPMSNTDREFLEGTGEQFSKTPGMGDFYKRVAERHGQNTKGKTYISGLARFPGDPEAWVTGRGDVKRVCEQRGWDCDGSVKVKGVKPDTSGPYRVADDLVADRASDLLAAGAARDAEEAGHKAREQLSPKPRPTLKDLGL